MKCSNARCLCGVNLIRKVLITVLLSFLPVLPAWALDWDGDGIDDPLVIQVGEDKNLDWNVVESEKNFSDVEPLPEGSSFGILGDHLAPATWLGGEVPQLGYVTLSDEEEIDWVIRGDSTHTISFGQEGDTAIAGGDFNGNGFADVAVLQDDGSYIVRRDAFGNVEGGEITPSTVVYQFRTRQAKRGQATFVGIDEFTQHYPALVMSRSLRRTNKNRHVLVYVNASGETVRQRLAGVCRGTITYAAPIVSESENYLLTVHQMKPTKHQIRVHRISDGALVSRTGYRTKGVVLVGDFMGKGYQQFGVRQPGALRVIDPFESSDPEIINTGSGVLADGVNVKSFSDNSGLGAVCPTIAPVVGGMLWKPASEHSGAPREGKPGMFFKVGAPGDSCVSVYANNGQKVSQMGHYNAGTLEYGKRYYMGWGCGDGKSGSQIATAAKAAAGNTDVYVKTSGNICRGPINPTQRNGAL